MATISFTSEWIPSVEWQTAERKQCDSFTPVPTPSSTVKTHRLNG